jgi:hypothetical protein
MDFDKGDGVVALTSYASLDQRPGRRGLSELFSGAGQP